MARLSALLLLQRGHLFSWVPVCLSIGIGTYFALQFEPKIGLIWSLLAVALLILFSSRLINEAYRPLAIAVVFILLGFSLAAFRAHSVAAPALDWRYYGPVEGRIVAIDRSGSDAIRLTLDQVILERVAPHKTPKRVRISLHGKALLGVDPDPGLRVITTAHLSPPGGPVEPGGFDFRRHAWFSELGAVGYTRVPLLAIEAPKPDGFALVIFKWRHKVGQRVLTHLRGDVGGFAVAVTTGARGEISKQGLEDLRASNLAHLLAISGLHMGLLSGFVFTALRIGLALVPFVALRWPTRKMAAAGALLAATGYLMMSGGNVSTERAYVMAAVALSAIMFNRRAISLRSVAIAAIIVLSLRPEALMGPGFQMSFAATTALVVVFGWIRERRVPLGPKWLKPVLAVVISSAVAGAATAPIGAAHFNVISQYGLLANLLSVPVMGAVVVPAAVLAFCLSPLGLDWIGLWIMGLGLGWILEVAGFVASLDGARLFVPGPPAVILPMMALGILWLMLWQGRLKHLGAMPVVMSFWLWINVERPVALIAENGTLVGVMTPEGRALSKAKGAGFIAEVWLENDGDPADQSIAAARWDRPLFPLENGSFKITHLSGKRAASAFKGCDADQIVVASVEINVQDCLVFDPNHLRRTGAIALVLRDGRLITRSVRDATGERLWSSWKD